MSDDEINKYKKGYKAQDPTKAKHPGMQSKRLKKSSLKSSDGNSIDTSAFKLKASNDGKPMLQANNAASLDLRSKISPVNLLFIMIIIFYFKYQFSNC